MENKRIVKKLGIAFWKVTHCDDCHHLIITPAIWFYFLGFWELLRGEREKVAVCPKCIKKRRTRALMLMTLGAVGSGAAGLYLRKKYLPEMPEIKQ